MRRAPRSSACSSCSTSSTTDPRAAARDHRTPGPAPGVFFCAPPIAARCSSRPVLELELEPIAAPPDRRAARAGIQRRPMPGRDPPAASPWPPIPRRPMSPGAPTDRVIRPPSGIQKSRPPGRRPGPDGPKAWAMFQTNNTAVFPTERNYLILPLNIAYILHRGPYAETR